MSKKPPDIFRPAINAELKRLGWSRYRLAKEAGIFSDNVRKYLNGDRESTTANLQSMLRALKLTKLVRDGDPSDLPVASGENAPTGATASAPA